MAEISYKKLALTLIIGLVGASAATYLGVPAAALIGASLAVSVASLCGVTENIPLGLRNVAFAVIGCSLGSGFTSEVLEQAAQWLFSLAMLGVAVFAIVFVCSLILARFFNQSVETSVLATSPGALAYSLALAADGLGDIRSVTVIQNVRILLVTTTLPLLLGHLGLATGHGGHRMISGGLDTLVIIPIAFLLGLLVDRWKVPAAFLMAGMLVSGVAHYLGLVVGRPPAPVLFVGFSITGSMIGARFSSIPLTDLRRLLIASISTFMSSTLIAVGFSYLVARVIELPFGQVFIAFAPGGVEAMAVMAISLGYDPAYVATHHLFRIVLLLFTLSFTFGVVRKLLGRR